MPWLGAVQAVLGVDMVPAFSGVVFSRPDSPAQQWHIDSPHIDSPHIDPHAVNVLLALEDLTLEQGPTEVFVGSHRRTNHMMNPKLSLEDMLYQSNNEITPAKLTESREESPSECFCTPLSQGSALIFDDRMLHRGLANNSQKTRWVAYFSYRQPNYVGTTHFEATRSLLMN